MKNKLYLYGATVAGAVMAFGLAAFANADAYFTVATGTAASLTANVGAQMSDPGTVEIVAIGVGIPLAFWIISALIGFIPRHRTHRS